MRDETRNTSDLAEGIEIQEIIKGLAKDLADLRVGKISISQARVSAALGKELFSGVRLMISARKMLEDAALPAPVVKSED